MSDKAFLVALGSFQCSSGKHDYIVAVDTKAKNKGTQLYGTQLLLNSIYKVYIINGIFRSQTKEVIFV